MCIASTYLFREPPTFDAVETSSHRNVVQSIFSSLTRPDISTLHRAAAEVAHKGSGEVVGPVGFVERF